MKNLLILIVISGLMFAGCMSDNLVNPVPQSSSDQNLQWIQNQNNLPKTETELMVSKSINGNQGGKIFINEKLGDILISGSLSILPGAYPGMQNISITFSDLYFYQVYTPTPYYFRIPLVLNLVYKNVDLTGIDPKSVGFYYLGEDNKLYKAKYEAIEVDVINRTLGIVNAEIPHFSRWGWAKSEED